MLQRVLTTGRAVDSARAQGLLSCRSDRTLDVTAHLQCGRWSFKSGLMGLERLASLHANFSVHDSCATVYALGSNTHVVLACLARELVSAAVVLQQTLQVLRVSWWD
jgi:hypothetical protein